jgi:gamma-glutamylcyclotransferase
MLCCLKTRRKKHLDSTLLIQSLSSSMTQEKQSLLTMPPPPSHEHDPPIGTSKEPTLYFGYALWKAQMRQRCPTSTYVGIARLKGYKWIINERGYANVVELTPEEKESKGYADEVWELVYTLEEADEERLDRNEGVPHAYTKEDLEVEFWGVKEGQKHPDVEAKPKAEKMLVYINRKMVTEDKPKHEYVYRMKMGIHDALLEGMPRGYVEEVMRRFIPEMQPHDEVVETARKQAVWFEEDER